mmetsp:Transcript_37730/g.70360  ORF Transcript_37730/g.70360 Transcript_37730/m.70360 type:complete len:174 (-) Transcript_37730:231-752(-)
MAVRSSFSPRGTKNALGRVRLGFCLLAVVSPSVGWLFVPAAQAERRHVINPQRSILLASSFAWPAWAEEDDISESSGFNPFLVLVPAAVLGLLGWVFSLRPEMDDDADGYRSTTLRGRDSEENLKRRIAERDALLALEEKERQALLNGGDEDLDDDLFSADLDAQLRAAQDKA